MLPTRAASAFASLLLSLPASAESARVQAAATQAGDLGPGVAALDDA